MPIDAIVKFVVWKLGDLLIQEAIFLIGVDEQVRLLMTELQWMLLFTGDTNLKRRSDPRVKLWVSQLREVTFLAEDVIDEFLIKIYQHMRIPRCSKGYLISCISCDWELRLLHKLGSQIEVINNMTSKIASNTSKYCNEIVQVGELSTIRSSNETKLQSNRTTYALKEEFEMVGLHEKVEEVKSLVIGGNQKQRIIVSLVGMPGIGKTTLAWKIYNDSNVQRHFGCLAWVSVSQEYAKKELLQRILKCFGESYDDQETEEDLGMKFDKFMQSETKYFLVLDDIWDIQAWNDLKPLLPDKRNGSRVMLTTRDKSIASQTNTPFVRVELRLLKDEEPWELFQKTIFQVGGNHSGKTIPTELKDLGEMMLAQCGGLPLAIVVLGGLLSSKDMTLNVWFKVNDNVRWLLSHLGPGGSDSCTGILALSYYDLPDYLKPVFLYIGIFPEDHEISVSKLIQYWTAEGFIERRGKEALEDTAEDYFETLVDKCLVHVTKRKANGSAAYFRIHDLLRDFCITEAEDDKFFHRSGNIDFTSPKSVRRVTIHNNDLMEECFSQKVPTPHLRSLMCFSRKFKCFSVGVKLLRVLELGGSYMVRELPKEIGELVHLRYLGLMHTGIASLPDSMARLANLQTLDVRYTYLKCLPKENCSLHELRHLYAHAKFCVSMLSLVSEKCFRRRPLGIDNLKNLQTLVIPAGHWIRDGCGVDRLKMLRKIEIWDTLVPYKKIISDFIAKLVGLRSLKLHDSEEIPTLEPFSHFTYLYKLHLDGTLERLPNADFFPPNLNKLVLHGSKLKKDPMKILQTLPKLKVLRLYSNAFTGRKMVCSEGGFSQLQTLEISGLSKFAEWRVEKRSLGCLTYLLIEECEKLKMIPDGLRGVTTLQTLKLHENSKKLESRVQRKSDDWKKIQHIPYVEIKIKQASFMLAGE